MMDLVVNATLRSVHTTFRSNQIEQFPHIRLNDDDIHSNCSICINHFNKDETILILPCIHKFHNGCINPWLLKNNTCPTCRRKVIQDINEESGDEESDEDDSIIMFNTSSDTLPADRAIYNNTFVLSDESSSSDMSFGAFDQSSDVSILDYSLPSLNSSLPDDFGPLNSIFSESNSDSSSEISSDSSDSSHMLSDDTSEMSYASDSSD